MGVFVKPHIKKFEEKFETLIVFVTLFLLVLIALRESQIVPEIYIPLLNFIDFLIYLTFIYELLFFTYHSKDRKEYLIEHWFNVLIVLFPFLRIFRLFGVFNILRIEMLLRTLNADSILLRVVLLIVKASSNVKLLFKKNSLYFIVPLIVFLIIFLGAFASVFERQDPSANIVNTYEGIWWGITSITTVGYGDRYPVTPIGRLIGIVLMTIGIAAFSLLTANVSSFFIGRQEDTEIRKIMKKLNKIEEEVEDIREQV